MQPARILVVDDNLTNATMYGHMVEAMGHAPTITYRGEQALDYLERQTFDLMLLDIMMPGMNGFEVLEVLRERLNLQELPVIVLSALDAPEDVARGLAAGANDYMTKPANLKVFTRRVQTQLKLKRMNDDHAMMLAAVQEANDFKDTLMRIASHDLRNPVQSISLILNLLKEPLKDDADSMEMLTMATRLAHNMETMITDFLDLELAEDGKLTVNMEPINVQDAVNDVFVEQYHAAQEKGVTVHIDVPDVTVSADKARIRQVLNNLVSNAIKYTPPNTDVHIDGEATDTMFEVHVRDCGAGIAPHEVDKLFTPFGKLSTRPTAGESSTGLGLWIVKSLMEAQNGAAYYNTGYTGGADFIVAFLLANSATQSAPVA
ncbi:MAG: hybrid sensor histidine kinase/response regulator [Chloroflexota bacterium]